MVSGEPPPAAGTTANGSTIYWLKQHLTRYLTHIKRKHALNSHLSTHMLQLRPIFATFLRPANIRNPELPLAPGAPPPSLPDRDYRHFFGAAAILTSLGEYGGAHQDLYDHALQGYLV